MTANDIYYRVIREVLNLMQIWTKLRVICSIFVYYIQCEEITVRAVSRLGIDYL